MCHAPDTLARMTHIPPDWLRPQWPAPAHVHALCTTRTGGHSQPPYDRMNLGDHVGDDPHAVAANRGVLQAALQSVTPQAQAVFLVEKSELNAIWNKYLNDRAYADAADRGVIYKCVFEKLHRVGIRDDGYNVLFTSILSIHDAGGVKRIRS